ncbi:MAG: hypothetical protein D6744_07325, partial [Planctomycetota bacterium]
AFDTLQVETDTRVVATVQNVTIGGQPDTLTIEILGSNLLAEDLTTVNVTELNMSANAGVLIARDINVTGQDVADAFDNGFDTFGDLIFGGADTFIGGRQNDEVDLLAGNDIGVGKGGDDTLFGGAGDDRIVGGAGHDSLEGGLDNDTLFGRSGNDVLMGDDGADRLLGGRGRDDMDGGDGADFLDGNAGFDTMNGGAGNDSMFGGAGRDVLKGGADNDLVKGNAGDDMLNGGGGDDTLAGGGGADTLVFVSGDGDDLVKGFAPGTDLLDLSGVTEITDFQDLSDNHMVQDGVDVLITYGEDSIRLQKVDLDSLTDGDFNFLIPS